MVDPLVFFEYSFDLSICQGCRSESLRVAASQQSLLAVVILRFVLEHFTVVKIALVVMGTYVRRP